MSRKGWLTPDFHIIRRFIAIPVEREGKGLGLCLCAGLCACMYPFMYDFEKVC